MKTKLHSLMLSTSILAALVIGIVSELSLSQTRNPIFSTPSNSNRIRLDFSKYPYQITPKSNSVGYPVGSAICKVFLVPELAAQSGRWVRRSAPRQAGQRAAAVCNATSTAQRNFHVDNMFTNQPDEGRCLDHGKTVANTCRSSAVVVYQTTASDKKRWILTASADGLVTASAPTRLNVSEVPRQRSLGRKRSLEEAITNLEQSKATYIRMQNASQPVSTRPPATGTPTSSIPTIPTVPSAQTPTAPANPPAPPSPIVTAPPPQALPSAPVIPTVPKVPTAPSIPAIPSTQPLPNSQIVVTPTAPQPPAQGPAAPAQTAPPQAAPPAAATPFVCQPGLINPATKQPCPLVAAPSVPTPPRTLPSPGRGGTRAAE